MKKTVMILVLIITMTLMFYSCSKCSASSGCPDDIQSQATWAFTYTDCMSIDIEGTSNCSVSWTTTIY